MKLSEIVLLRDQRLDRYVFNSIAALRVQISKKLDNMRDNELMQILKMARSYQQISA